MASIIDYILPQDQEMYKQIIERAAEAKANAPKERKPRAPLSPEQKLKMDENRLLKLQEKLAAMRAAAAINEHDGAVSEDDDGEEII